MEFGGLFGFYNFGFSGGEWLKRKVNKVCFFGFLWLKMRLRMSLLR